MKGYRDPRRKIQKSVYIKPVSVKFIQERMKVWDTSFSSEVERLIDIDRIMEKQINEKNNTIK